MQKFTKSKKYFLIIFSSLLFNLVRAQANDPTPVAKDATTNQVNSNPTLSAYENYDFVPGEKILLFDDFNDDQPGEFPTHWRLDYGQGVVSNFDGKKVFALTEGEGGDHAVVMEPRMKKKSGYMPANFTVELDIYIPRKA